MSTVMTAGTAGSGTHRREHGSLLARVEKTALIWIAERLPGWVTSDQLTALGALAMAGAGAALAAAAVDRRALLVVPLLLAVNWFGDSLDGTVARVRGHQRPRYGYYLDHVVDLVNATLLFGGLAASGLLQPVVGLAVLIAYLLLCAESFLATHAVGIFRISFSIFGPTELRIILAAGALTAFARPVVSPFGLGPVRLFDLGGVIAVAGMVLAFAVSSIRNARELARAEPLPGRRR